MIEYSPRKNMSLRKNIRRLREYPNIEHEYFKQEDKQKNFQLFCFLFIFFFFCFLQVTRSQSLFVSAVTQQLLFSSTVGAFYKLHLLFITGKTDVILN